MTRALLIAALVVIPWSVRAQADPSSLPAHDRHGGLLVAADPYVDAARAKEKFGGKNPVNAGILPIEVFFRNETQGPIRIRLETLRLDVSPPNGSHQHLEPLSAEKVAELIVYPGGTPNPESSRRRVPRPIPMPSHDKKIDQLSEKFRSLALDSDVIPPLATIHGFLFFDLGNDFGLVPSSSLYIPDVKLIQTNEHLMFFEIPLSSAGHP
jgi:hypothetical protein